MPLDPFITLSALALEAILGYPNWLHRRVPHPVVWLGRMIDALELQWNRAQLTATRRRALGVVTVVTVAGTAGAAGIAIQAICASFPAGIIAIALIATLGLAQRSLNDHVAAVSQALTAHDLPTARAAVAKIVGRDTASLDESGVAAAATESLAESFNDGIVAPAFWLLIGGLPGLFAYKAINTADSLIGHLEPRWRAFGWAAARIDDLVNWIPARIAGTLIAMAAAQGFGTMLRDARKHASPNAGWPEAALAGALALKLGGPATYEGHLHNRPWFGAGRTADPADLQRALKIYRRACVLLWLAVAAIGVLCHL